MRNAVLSAAFALFLVLAGGTVILVRDLHQDLAEAHIVLENTASTGKHLDQAIGKVSTAADTLNSAASEERANWQRTSTEAAKTGLALRELIDDLRKSSIHVNLVTLPAIDAQIEANGNQLSSTIRKLGETADGLTGTATRLNAKLDDPEISRLLGQLNATAANIQVISENSAAMSGDMKLAVHRLAQPPSKFHQFLDVAWTTAKFGSLFIP